MTAVFVNMATVLLGSAIGILFRNKINQKYIYPIISALALATLSIGISSAIKTEDILCMIICLALGTAIGEALKIDTAIENCGNFIREKLLRGKIKKGRFTEGFVSACILFCVGSMTIMGSFEAGINKNYDFIYAKSALDFVSSIMFAAAMGLGVPFSALFILVFQGGLTLMAELVAPYLSTAVVTEMTAVGGAILIGMSINLFELSEKRINVANMLPAVFLPILYIPVSNLISSVF